MRFKTHIIVDDLKGVLIWWVSFLIFVIVMYYLTGHSSWAWWLVVPLVGSSDDVHINLNYDNNKSKKDSNETEDKKNE